MWQSNIATLHLEWALELYRVRQVAEAEQHSLAAGAHAALAVEQARGPDAERWRQDGQTREIRYLHGVGMLTNHGSSLHTHDPEAMELMLAESRPDLAFADHGFAGAAIQAGVETISIVDINDPAPVVARAQGRTELVIVLDDNVLPEDYWPCFQAIAAQFP